jgi:uncharacterized SAM-dependent methyltransferase
VRAQCGPDGGILIGIDLAKEHAVLDAAYDDALGVTAAFNLNVLRHANRLLGADFDIRAWRHHGFYNERMGRVEMHLEASSQQVSWQGGSRRFEAGECIHTENSYKYRESRAVGLLEQAGFAASGVWTDARGWFAVIHARAIPPARCTAREATPWEPTNTARPANSSRCASARCTWPSPCRSKTAARSRCRTPAP